MKKMKNGEIEWLRMIMALIIMLYHARVFSCANGWLCTDAFFVISGVFLAKEINKYTDKKVTDATWNYMKRRYIGFWKYFIGAFILTAVTETIYLKLSLGEVLQRLLLSVPHLIFMDRIGKLLGEMFYVGGSWYLAIIIACSWILFPLLLKYKNIMFKVICPLVFIGGMAFLYFVSGSIKYESHPIFAPVRGLSEMSLGVWCYFAATQMQEKINANGKKILSIVSVFIYAFFIFVCFKQGIRVEIEILALILIGVNLIISLGKNNLLWNIKKYPGGVLHLRSI